MRAEQIIPVLSKEMSFTAQKESIHLSHFGTSQIIPLAFGLMHFIEIQNNHPPDLFHSTAFYEALQRAFLFQRDKGVLLSH